MCQGTNWVGFDYVDSITRPGAAFILNLFGFRYGWNPILMPEDSSSGPIPLGDDQLTGLVFDNAVCPFVPGD